MERRKSLTLDNPGNTVDTQDEGVDSPVIKALRSQIKDLERELKARPDRDTLAAELRTQLDRDNEIIAQLKAHGHPAGILDVVKSKLGDGEVTSEGVASALTGIGYQLDGAGTVQDSGVQDNPDLSDLAKVTSLSREVSSAASGATPDSIMDKISSAQSPEELAAVMGEAGLTAEHH